VIHANLTPDGVEVLSPASYEFVVRRASIRAYGRPLGLEFLRRLSPTLNSERFPYVSVLAGVLCNKCPPFSG